MIEFTLWILVGSLTGWIGYLCSRTDHTNIKPYLLWAILAAICGGLFIKITDSSSGVLSINTNSLIFAMLASSISMIALGYLGNSRAHS